MIRQVGAGDSEPVMSGAEPAFAPMLVAGRTDLGTPSLAPSDEKRFRQIVAANLDFVWRCLRRMGIRSGDVDDAAQQVFLVVASKLDLVQVGSERAFLFSTASRVAANSRRSVHRRDEALQQMVQGDVSHDPTQEELTDQLRARALMDGVLSEMPSDLREVFVLFELEELPVAEVAEVLSIPIGTVGSRLRRAREDFHDRVRRIKAMTEHRGAGR